MFDVLSRCPLMPADNQRWIYFHVQFVQQLFLGSEKKRYGKIEQIEGIGKNIAILNQKLLQLLVTMPGKRCISQKMFLKAAVNVIFASTFLVASNDLEKSFVFVTCSLLCWAAFFQRHSPSRLNCSFPSIHIFTGYYHSRLAVGTRCLFPFYIFLQTIVVVGNTKKACCLFFV